MPPDATQITDCFQDQIKIDGPADKPEDPKPEDAKPEAPKTEAPKTEAPKAEEAKLVAEQTEEAKDPKGMGMKGNVTSADGQVDKGSQKAKDVEEEVSC